MNESDLQKRLHDITEKWKQHVEAVRILGEQQQQARDQAYRLEGAKLTLEDMLAEMQGKARVVEVEPAAADSVDPHERPMPARVMPDMDLPAHTNAKVNA